MKNGVVQDKLFLPGLLKLQAAHRRRLLRPDPVGARRVRLLGLRGRLAGRPAPVVELPRRGRRRHRARHVPALALRAGEPVRPRSSRSTRQAVTHVPERVDEQGRSYAATADDAAYGIFELEGGDHRPDQLLLDRPGQPRRAGGVPGGRHARQRGRGPAQLPRPAPRRHPQAGLEPRPARHRAASATAGRRCPTTPSSTTASRSSGSSSSATCVEDAPFPYDFASGARGVQLAELGLRSSAEGRRIEVPPTCETSTLPGGDVHPASSRVTWRRPAGRRRPSRDRLRRRARGRRPARRQHARLPRRRRLGRHAALPPPPVVARPARRRRHGHRPAQHGPGLGGHPRADPAQRRRGRARSATRPRWWPAARAPTTRPGAADLRRDRSPPTPSRSRPCADAGAGVDHHGQPAARRGRARARGLPPGVRASCSARPTGR